MTDEAPRPSAHGPGPVPVIAAVIVRDGRYLVGRRPDEKRHGGLWEFPGGKLAAGEDWLGAARRELAEEMGMQVSATGRLLLTVEDEGAAFVIHFVEVEATGEPMPTEHTAVGWSTPDELAAMPLAPADARFVESLRGTPGA